MQPDANASGPVYIPHVYDGRNKTFFFFGYQKLIEKKSAAFTSQTPTPASLGGDFTFGGLGQQLYDPLTTRQLSDSTWTRDPIPGNVIPRNRFDPVASKILSLNPWVPPNTPGSLTSTGPVSNYTWASKSRTFFEDYSQRIDQQFSSDFKLYGSYTYNHQGGLQRPTSIAIPAFDGANGINSPFTQRNLSIGATKFEWIQLTDAGSRRRRLNPGQAAENGLYLYSQCMPGRRGGVTVLAINTSSTARELRSPLSGALYTLTAKELNSEEVALNGRVLKASFDGSFPTVQGTVFGAGNVSLPPTSSTFLTFSKAGNC